MSWTSARLSLRARLVFWSAVSAAVVTLTVGMTVSLVSHFYLYGTAARTLARLADDLADEYGEMGGFTPAFRACIDEDVDEHDPKRTYIRLTDPSGRIVYETAALRHGRHEHRQTSVRLGDGSVIQIVIDTEDIRHFMTFLYVLFGAMFVVSVFGIGGSAYVIGGRILSLNELLREKESAYDELRTLTDDIAHDLRTPLTRMAMAAESAVLGEDAERLPVRVSHECHAMLEMIGTMLEISQTSARIDRTPRERLDLVALVRAAGELYAPVAEDAQLTFSVSVPATPVPFSGHKGKLQQLVANLLENAIKFTPAKGRVALGLSASGGTIVLTVEDTGCGISPEDIPHVFKRFWRADSSRHLLGNGLGLALVKAIVTSYGGTIACRSRVGEGTVFSVSLPRF